MDIPSSLTALIGQRILRFGNTYNREVFFLDVPKLSGQPRTRWAYRITGGGYVSSSFNLAPLLGNVLLDVYDAGFNNDGRAKLVFETNPTDTKIERSIIYLVMDTEITIDDEDGDWMETEDGESLLVEDSGESNLEDTLMPKQSWGDVDTDNRLLVIQEDDFTEDVVYG